VIATKAGSVPDPYRRFDGSRGHLLAALDASLQRLGTDHVDLWQVHAFDPVTPLEETLQALDIAVASGRVRYVGVSNFCGWQLAKAATWQRAATGRTPLASTQMEYSLLQRGIEREVLPAALDLGLGLLPSSPLGRGVLTGKYRHGTPADSRGGSESMAPFVAPYLDQTARRIVDALAIAADGLATTPLQVSLAWVRDRPGVAAPIVGARNAQQLMAALSVEALSLPEEICQALDDVSAPLHRYPDHDWSTL
jgi:aryl-alcohol dehydrogenase-like predicted oxidoreductase